MRAATMLILGMMVMPNYGLMGKKASAEDAGLLGALGAQKEMLARRLQAGEITMDEYSAMSQRLVQDHYSSARRESQERGPSKKPYRLPPWPSVGQTATGE
jgi:hypothetical protein